MRIEIYKLNQSNTYLVLPEGGSPPEHLSVSSAAVLKRLTLKPGEVRVGMDVDAVRCDIERQGWATVTAAIVVEVM